MANKKKIKKRVVSTSSKTSGKTLKPTSRRSTAKKKLAPLVFGKKNYQIMAIGFGLILLGLALMSGGAMPSPDVWDDSLIYSARRTIIAPFFILLGLAAQVLAIFK